MTFKDWAKGRPVGKPGTHGYMMVEAAWNDAQTAERERWRLRVIGLQAQYNDPACRAALKHVAAYGTQPEA